MNTYHILYKFDSSSKGENFTHKNPVSAYSMFRQKYPNNIFIGMYCLEALESLHFNTKATQEAAEVDDVIRANKAEMQKRKNLEDKNEYKQVFKD